MRIRLPIFVLLLCVSGCGLFSTRPPEPPDTGSTFIWTPATSVDYLLENFIGTLELLDGSNHIRVFIAPGDTTGSGSKTYTFIPTPGLDQSGKSIFATWSVESERGYISKLKSLLPANSKLQVLLTNRVLDQSNNTATLTADYTISLPTAVNSGLPSVVTGSLQFQLLLVSTEQGGKEWRIVSWSDFIPKGGSISSTWTSLKVKLAS